jgi:hypothetical protein
VKIFAQWGVAQVKYRVPNQLPRRVVRHFAAALRAVDVEFKHRARVAHVKLDVVKRRLAPKRVRRWVLQQQQIVAVHPWLRVPPCRQSSLHPPSLSVLDTPETADSRHIFFSAFGDAFLTVAPRVEHGALSVNRERHVVWEVGDGVFN